MGFWPGPPLNLAKISDVKIFFLILLLAMNSTKSQNLEVDQNENKFEIFPETARQKNFGDFMGEE